MPTNGSEDKLEARTNWKRGHVRTVKICFVGIERKCFDSVT